jgi:hypothetical protein
MARAAIPLPHAVPRDEPIALAGSYAAVFDLRIDVGARRVDVVAPPPAGLRRYASSGITVEADGTVFLALRDVALGAVYASPDLGATWTAIAGTYLRSSMLHRVSAGGTHVVVAADEYVGETSTPWAGPPRADTLEGPGAVIARAADGRFAKVRADSRIALSSDGRCVAYWEHGDTASTLRMWDLVHDRAIAVATARSAGEVRWIEPPAPAAGVFVR